MLMLVEELPKSPVWPHPPQNTVDNVREAMALIARNLEDHAASQGRTGWLRKGDIEWSTNPDGSAVIGRMYMER